MGMSFAPNGAQVLMPVSQPGVSVASTGVVPWTTGLLSSPNQTLMSQQTGAVASLEARAAALSAHAAEVRAAARRAKAAAAAARRQSNSGEHDEFCRMSAAFETEKQENAVPKSRTGPDDRTTLMLRNLPNNYTRTAVLDMLDSEGLAGTYCFVYVPTDFKNFTGFGYAFVGFCAHEHAAQAKRHYQGFSRWKVPSQKTCDVAWSGPVQGLEQHTERYRNSPVTHHDCATASREKFWLQVHLARDTATTVDVKVVDQCEKHNDCRLDMNLMGCLTLFKC